MNADKRSSIEADETSFPRKRDDDRRPRDVLNYALEGRERVRRAQGRRVADTDGDQLRMCAQLFDREPVFAMEIELRQDEFRRTEPDDRLATGIGRRE